MALRALIAVVSVSGPLGHKVAASLPVVRISVCATQRGRRGASARPTNQLRARVGPGALFIGGGAYAGPHGPDSQTRYPPTTDSRRELCGILL